MAGFLASGCGSTDDTVVTNTGTSQQINEAIIIPQSTTPGTLTIKFINLQNGTSIVANSGINSGGNTPQVVKTHPTRPQFFVANQGSANVVSFSLNGSGGVSNLGTIAAPTNVQFLQVHPNGAFVYAAGGSSIQAYAVQPDGSLQAVGGAVALAGNVGNEGCISNNGLTLHVPETGRIESFAIDPNTGALSAPVATALQAGGDVALDVNLHPNGSVIEAVVDRGANDQIRSYAVAGGTLGAVTVQDFAFGLGSGDFARNGQYYTGETGSPANIHAYNVNSSTGALTELAGSPKANPNSSFLMGLDPSNQFIFAVGSSTLDTQGRLSDGTLSGVTSDSAGVNASARRFDFFQLVQNI